VAAKARCWVAVSNTPLQSVDTKRTINPKRLLETIAGIQTGFVELWNGRPECLSNRDFEPSGAFALINNIIYSKYYKREATGASMKIPRAGAQSKRDREDR
jgi:hypothetical protein